MSIIKPEWHEISEGPFVAIQQVKFGNEEFMPGDDIPKSVKADGGRTVMKEFVKREPVLNSKGRKQYNHLGKLLMRDVQKKDEDGNPMFEEKPVLDENGQPKVTVEERTVVDDNGSPVLNDDGETTTETVRTPVVERVPVVETEEHPVTENCEVSWEIDVGTLLSHFNLDIIGPKFVEEREYKYKKDEDGEEKAVTNDFGEHVFEMVKVPCEWTTMWVEHYKALMEPVQPEHTVEAIPEKYRSKDRKIKRRQLRSVEKQIPPQAVEQTEEPEDESPDEQAEEPKTSAEAKSEGVKALKDKLGIGKDTTGEDHGPAADEAAD